MYKVVQIWPGQIFFNHNCSSLYQLPDRTEQVLTRAGGRVKVVASLSQGRTATAAAQCGLFTHKSVPVIFEPPCIIDYILIFRLTEQITLWTKNNNGMTPILKKKSYLLASLHEGLSLLNCILNSEVGIMAVIRQKWDLCPETSLFSSHSYFTKPVPVAARSKA